MRATGLQIDVKASRRRRLRQYLFTGKRKLTAVNASNGEAFAPDWGKKEQSFLTRLVARSIVHCPPWLHAAKAEKDAAERQARFEEYYRSLNLDEPPRNM